MTAVLDLASCDHGDAARVGGKAIGLARLLGQSLEVPPGFVVTTDAYRAAGGERIDAALAAEIRAAYEALGDDVPVAVRSSATAEDTAEASFAGQQETYLWISGAKDVLRNVEACWASLFTPQAVSYRARLDIEADDVAMAVVVQRMVDAAAAGVMITIDPVTGDPSQILIEGAFGLGPPVVGGEITPDRFGVDKITREIRNRHVAHKGFAERFDGGGVRRIELADDIAASPCISDEEVLRLADLGARAERALGCAQDMEWAIGPGDDGPRTVHLLQARPETVWSTKPRAPLTGGGGAMAGIVRLLGGTTRDGQETRA